jgi:hypothetical protein
VGSQLEARGAMLTDGGLLLIATAMFSVALGWWSDSRRVASVRDRM